MIPLLCYVIIYFGLVIVLKNKDSKLYTYKYIINIINNNLVPYYFK